MTKLKKLSSLALTITVMVFGMALTAGNAQAANIVFAVDEGTVPLANNTTVTADGLTAKYLETLSLTGTTSGTFSSNITIQFTAYTLGNTTITSQLDQSVPGGTPPPPNPGETTNTNLYAMYGLVAVGGSFSTSTNSDGNTVFEFHPTTSSADIYLDPARDTTIAGGDFSGDDEHILMATTILPILSSGSVTLCTNAVTCTGFIPNTNIPIFGSVLTGSFALVYTDPSIVGDGVAYWPTLANTLNLVATASGDVDPTSEAGTSLFPNEVRGDTSIHFSGAAPTTVPEPASLFLLGSGLMGVAGWRRRRSATN